MLRDDAQGTRNRHRVVFACLVALLITADLTPTVGLAEARILPPVRDVGEEAGLPTAVPSYAVHARDVDRDGWADLLFVHHGGPTQLFRNTGDGFELWNTFVHDPLGKGDLHDCAWGDVDRDGLVDLYCVKGAQQGLGVKRNELWMQQPDGTFIDRAADYRVLDRWGRGRRTAFIDLNGDPFPDLFVGNMAPRQDDHRSPNRTFINKGGRRFREVRLGLTREVGTFCVQVADVDRDGREDVLLCESRKLRLYLRRSKRFVDASKAFGLRERRAVWARLAPLGGDQGLDIAVVMRGRLSVRLRSPAGRFRPPVLRRRLTIGQGLAVGNIDGRRGRDLLIVQGCKDGTNVDDLLLLNDGTGSGWREHELPSGAAGCGDVATALDFDRDGMKDFVVMNGAGQGGPATLGPDQLLTMGDWSASS